MKSKLFYILTAAALLSFQNKNFAQAPTLGTTADFELFTSVGAISNTGISHITGSVGSNSGLSTGFGNVDGVMNDNNGVSGQCAADLTIAYNQLNADVPTFFPAPLLGNGQILVPGVYSIPGAATLNLNLILDAQNNPNAVFVFQIQGPLSCNANSKVKIINQGLACNVFWKIEGLVSMATGTTMRGTVIANNAAINMNTGDTLEGRALSTSGAITIDGVLAYTPIGCGSPLLTGPVAADLLSTACYTIFSSIGPVTNVGVTFVTGDIGSDNGLTTGYNPLNVTGMIHPIPDASTAACATDLITVYNYLNLLPYDIELLYPAQFGNNLVLTPHTYLMNAACTFTDTLYLNAEGDANAVFVIHINGALGTSTYSKVNLINGAQAQNVFWEVNGAVTINDYSVFEGTIICNNGAMNINTGVTLHGRALTTTGAISTSAITAISPPGCGGFAPNITSQPVTQTVCAGDSVSFYVAATGASLTYQWRKGNVNLVNGGNISGATNDTLTINPVGVSDAGNYNVIITGSSAPNDTSINVALVVNTAPNITSLSANQSVCAGDSVSFIVAASGNGLTYQWRKGNVNLINAGNISGVTNDTLTINPVNALDASANYNVIITGTCGPDTSINVSLLINAPAVIVTQPSNQTTCVGSSVSFSVTATGNGLMYQWRKGIVNLVNAGNISGATSAILTINPANVTDAAVNYNVIVSGTCGASDTSNNASLILNALPVITTEPSNQTTCGGNSVSFSVTATGTALTYQWRKGIVNLVNAGNISGATSAMLTINPASGIDAAVNYNVIVSGTCATNDTSVNVSLIINSSPVITSTPANQTVCESSSVSFSVSATGTGLNYQWRQGSINLVNGGNISGATSATLTINPVNISDAALNYNVIVSGTCSPNDTSANASLTVNPTPSTIATSNSPVCVDSTINLDSQTLIGGTYNWTGPNAFSASSQNAVIVSATTAYAGIYSVTVTDNGCTSPPATVLVVVNDCIDFHIPDGFSPNGDGVNDLFVIRGIEYYPANKFVIYNRWGEKVFSASPYTNTWDGKSQFGITIGGNDLPIGTYFYVLDLGDGVTPIYKGTIYLNK